MTKKTNGLTSFTLHILAMLFMLCDHLWATLFPAAEWLSCIGRLAFPIFAFMIAEGYSHTSNVKKYVLRLLICAVITEVPFDLFYGGTVFYPFHQNVLWTFLIALLTIILIEKALKLKRRFLGWVLAAVTVLVSYAVGTLAMVDYYGAGVLTVLVFYFFRERKWQNFAAQLVCLAVITSVCSKECTTRSRSQDTNLSLHSKVWRSLHLSRYGFTKAGADIIRGGSSGSAMLFTLRI